ncbi:MAG TPA: UDP-N-acetylmuramoyl-L-alanine--D-glutamate ligase [Woeseiaceae bacterium]|nr:UDP-N-acetylmuramoyl-L-alanine--D-glutamate ligase [Woeseiaceae bacterium]
MSAVQKTLAKDLVVGLGATGLSVARFLKRHGLDAAFCDTRDAPPGIDALNEIFPDVTVLLGSRLHLPQDTSRVIVSPGVPDSEPLIVEARRAGVDVVSDIELFVQAANAPFMAITGSNGKSTVTTLLGHMCNANGFRVRTGGNLGEPALDLLAGDAPDGYVLELSSFQLQRTAYLPADVAVLLNVAPDHLDWHRDEAEYRAAKYRIFREAKTAVVNRADAAVLPHIRHVPQWTSFGLDEPAPGHFGLRTADGSTYLAKGEELLLSTAELVLYGRHNQANALAALAAGDLAGLEMGPMLQVLAEFPGLPHRMQHVARVRGVDYVDDSKATNVAAAIASIESVDGMLVLVAGGVGKGQDFAPLGAALENRLRAAVLIGEDAGKVEAAIDTVRPVYTATDMDDAVEQAARYAEKGDTVLLAPACASFDMFANYGARGDAFAAAVRRLAP